MFVLFIDRVWKHFVVYNDFKIELIFYEINLMQTKTISIN